MLAIPTIELSARRGTPRPGDDQEPDAPLVDDPVTLARHLIATGFGRLHIRDLDAESDRATDRDLLRDVLRHACVPVQVSGGMHDGGAVSAVLAEGADWVIVGKRGVEDPDWLLELAARAPGRIILAAEFRDRQLVTVGWATRTRRTFIDLVSEIDHAPLAALLLTAVQMEGRTPSTDLTLIEDAVDAAPWAVIASGGIGSMLDLRNLEARGVSAAVLGVEFSTGGIDGRALAEEFAE